MFENFLTNLDIYQSIALNKDKKKEIPEDMKRSLLVDDSLRSKVETEVKAYTPVVKLIDVAQGKKCNLAQIAECWLKLESQLPDDCSSVVKKMVKERKDMALCDITLSAYFLDINKDKSLLTQWQKIRVEKFVNKNLRGDADALHAFAEFKQIGKEFYPICEGNDMDARIFWSSMTFEHPVLSKLAVRILNIPGSSAEIERVFSKWREVHTVLRNRLGPVKSEKLLRAYYFLHGNRPEKKKKEPLHSDQGDTEVNDDVMEAVNFNDFMQNAMLVLYLYNKILILLSFNQFSFIVITRKSAILLSI